MSTVLSGFVRRPSANSGRICRHRKPLEYASLAAVVLAAWVSLSPVASAMSSEAAEIQLQMAALLFGDGRYVEAFDVFESVKASEDPRIRREALSGCVTSALRLGDFSHAYADAQMLMHSAGNDVDALALYGDSLWATGQFEESEKQFQQAMALQPHSP